ncbi:MAG: restriction endonuclease subunit S [Phenylobacterium sp.]|uniref:hypothetical protein n=1 Tax=Phenylobacterium sp. TaxID=1871053 RepID=UPI0025D37C8F|nr:hypothetical protein [Phenylobacterium sp.]MCA3757320.1 restriction endonuclease subunit S [Phenylobacterium sp.]
MRLADLCQIHLGVTLERRPDPPTAEPAAKIVQLRDIVDDRLDLRRLDQVSAQGPLSVAHERHTVRPGDVVFRSRGQQTTAAIADGDANASAIAVAPVLILRPGGGIVTPEYLVWSLNLASTQRRLDRDAQGSALRMIPRAALENLELDIPTLETQQAITAASALGEREAELGQLLAAKRLDLINRYLRQMARQPMPPLRSTP